VSLLEELQALVERMAPEPLGVPKVREHVRERAVRRATLEHLL